MAAVPPDPALPAGTQLHAGKFVVGRVLGEGGFGITYQGAHQVLRRPVAIKELFPATLGAVRRGTRVAVPATQQEDFRRERDSALQEAQVVAGFRSRHIVDIHDMFLENDTAYIVMEYLEGKTLEAHIQEQGALPWKIVQQLAVNLCEALEEVHSHQMLHRDIKPANIMLTQDGRTVLIDFGSARAFRTGRTVQHTRILTEDYAAPEQYSREGRFGPCTDIFSLGATLYYALTGTPPDGALERLQEYASKTVTLPSGLPQPLGTAIQQALALRVEARPQTVEEFRAVLLGTRSDTPGSPDAAASRAGRRAGVDRDKAADLVARGTAKAAQGQYWDAIADYDQALRSDSDNAAAYRSRGDAKYNLKQYQAALADYDQALRLAPDDAKAYCNRGVAKAALKQHQVAFTDYDQALRLNPNLAAAYHNRGIAHAALDQYAEAINDYNRVLRLDPKDAAAYFRRGYARDGLGQYREAIADYDQALQLDPNATWTYRNRGLAKFRLGQYRQALADYDQALRLAPDNAEAYRNRGDAKTHLGRYADAIADYDQTLRLDPKDAEAYHSREEANEILDRQREAIADYDQTSRLDSHRGSVGGRLFRKVTQRAGHLSPKGLMLATVFIVLCGGAVSATVASGVVPFRALASPFVAAARIPTPSLTPLPTATRQLIAVAPTSVPTRTPTPRATLKSAATATLKPTVVPPTPIVPTRTPTRATPKPAAITSLPRASTPTPTLLFPHTNVGSNLRSGPGVEYDVVGVLAKDARVQPVSRSADQLWLKLVTGVWIHASLVDNVPSGLPTAIHRPTPPPPTATPAPASVPVQGDWSLPVRRNEPFLMQDGLEIRIKEVIHGDTNRMQAYIERRGGQDCEGCLAVKLEIVNRRGNTKEYVVQEDFTLLQGGPEAEPYPQVQCQHPHALRSMANPGSLRGLPKHLGGDERVLCFERVAALAWDMRLAYAPVFLFDDRSRPTPTPAGSLQRTDEPKEQEQAFRTGWTVFFNLQGT